MQTKSRRQKTKSARKIVKQKERETETDRLTDRLKATDMSIF